MQVPSYSSTSLHCVRPSRLESEFEITVKYVDMQLGLTSHCRPTGLDVRSRTGKLCIGSDFEHAGKER